MVILCNLTFVVALILEKGAIKGFEEASQVTLDVMWCLWQVLRIIIVARKQNEAYQDAKEIINFENVAIDTDFGGALQFRHPSRTFSATEAGKSKGDDRANISGDPDEIAIEIIQVNKDEEANKQDENLDIKRTSILKLI